MDRQTTEKRMESILAGLTYYYASGLLCTPTRKDRPTARWLTKWYLYWRGFTCFALAAKGEAAFKAHTDGCDAYACAQPKNKPDSYDGYTA